MIGPGTRGRITRLGNAVLVDGTELVILGEDTATHTTVVKRRVTLDAEPLEMLADDSGSVWMRFPGKLVRVGIFVDVMRSLDVGDGVLVSTLHQPYFFDGAKFRAVWDSSEGIHLDGDGPVPPAEDVARIGTPKALTEEGIVFGESGFLSIAGDVSGPRSVSYADVFGDGHLGPLSIDNGTYVIRHDDGSAELYQPPFSSHCHPL